jgi:hypothetical protein
MKINNRRSRLTPPPLKKPTKVPWKVTDNGVKKTPAWKVETDRKGRKTFTQLNPPMLTASQEVNKHARSRFTLEITDGCLVCGHSAKVGDIVECFSITASLLWERTRILEEKMNAL